MAEGQVFGDRVAAPGAAADGNRGDDRDSAAHGGLVDVKSAHRNTLRRILYMVIIGGPQGTGVSSALYLKVCNSPVNRILELFINGVANEGIVEFCPIYRISGDITICVMEPEVAQQGGAK